MIMRPSWRTIAVAAVTVSGLVVFAAVATHDDDASSNGGTAGDDSPLVTDTAPVTEPTTTVVTTEVPVIVDAAGDISCLASARVKPNACQQRAVANAMTDADWVVPLGDIQYPGSGGLKDVVAGYGSSWGQWNAIALPVIGNHEYKTAGAKGYFDYWAANGKVLTGLFQHYDLGNGWTFLSLNSNCGNVNCATQAQQVTAYLASLPAGTCVAAAYHHPRYSSGQHGNSGNKGVDTLYKSVVGKVELILNGHEHSYERRNVVQGTTAFTVGTGGAPQDPTTGPDSGTAKQIDQTFGFLRLSLTTGAWSAEYQAVLPSGAVLDTASGTC